MIYGVKDHSQTEGEARLQYEITYIRENDYLVTTESASEEVVYDMLFHITEHEGLPVLVMTNSD